MTPSRWNLGELGHLRLDVDRDAAGCCRRPPAGRSPRRQRGVLTTPRGGGLLSKGVDQHGVRSGLCYLLVSSIESAPSSSSGAGYDGRYLV
jgi:hypothetical protein